MSIDATCCDSVIIEGINIYPKIIIIETVSIKVKIMAGKRFLKLKIFLLKRTNGSNMYATNAAMQKGSNTLDNLLISHKIIIRVIMSIRILMTLSNVYGWRDCIIKIK